MARKRKKVKVCPHCGGREIEYASLIKESGSAFAGFGLPEKFLCKGCGYKGSVILEGYPSSLKHHRFKKTMWKPHKVERKQRLKDAESAQALRAVFVVIAFLFLISAFLLTLGWNDQVLASAEDWISASTNASGEPVITPPLTLEEQTGTREITRAIGHEQGFLPSLFFVFFISGLIILMIYSHWHRIRFFSG